MSLNDLSPSQLNLLDDPKWRKKNSKWRHIVWWSAGAYGVFALAYVAAKSKGKKAILAVAVSASLFAAFAFVQTQIPDLSDSQQAALEGTSRVATPLENVSSAILMAMIAFNIWMSFYLQKDWLVWVVSKKDNGSWVEKNLNVRTVNAKTGLQESAIPETDTVTQIPVVDSSEYLLPTVAPKRDKPGGSTMEIVDVNTATKQDVLQVSGVDESLATRILEVRDSRGIFRNFEDFCIALSLKPHEVRRLEGQFEFSKPSGTSNPGRILDV